MWGGGGGGGCTETQDYGVTGLSYSSDVKAASWPPGIHDYKFCVHMAPKLQTGSFLRAGFVSRRINGGVTSRAMVTLCPMDEGLRTDLRKE